MNLISSDSAVDVSLCIIIASTSLGIIIGGILPSGNKFKSVLPTIAVASALLLYMAEFILLKGRLYLLGQGIIFRTIPYTVLAPIDIAVILLPGVLTFVLLRIVKTSVAG